MTEIAAMELETGALVVSDAKRVHLSDHEAAETGCSKSTTFFSREVYSPGAKMVSSSGENFNSLHFLLLWHRTNSGENVVVHSNSRQHTNNSLK